MDEETRYIIKFTTRPNFIFEITPNPGDFLEANENPILYFCNSFNTHLKVKHHLAMKKIITALTLENSSKQIQKDLRNYDKFISIFNLKQLSNDLHSQELNFPKSNIIDWFLIEPQKTFESIVEKEIVEMLNTRRNGQVLDCPSDGHEIDIKNLLPAFLAYNQQLHHNSYIYYALDLKPKKKPRDS